MKEFDSSSGAAVATDDATSSDQFAHVALDLIEASLTNPRKHFNQERLAELASSITASGVHTPVILRPLPGTRLAETFGFRRKGAPLPIYELVAGERRLRASKIAGKPTIPARILQLTDSQVLEMQIVENLQRDDLTELEEAEGYERLMQHSHITADDVGAKIGKSRSYVYARLKLLDLCHEAKQAMRDGGIDASRALLIARIPDGALQLKALAYAAEVHEYTQLQPSVRDLQTWLQKNVMLRLERAPFQITDARLVEAAGSCKDCPKRTGANPDLFADVDGADICTDPACYNNKADTHRAAIISKAEAKGLTVIDGAQAKKICSQYRSDLKGYTPLSQLRNDIDGQRLNKLLGKDAPAPVLIENPWTKELIEAVPTEEAEAVLLAKGLIKVTAAAKDAQEELDNEVERLKDGIEWKVKSAVRGEMFQALLTAIAATPPAQAAHLLTPDLLRQWLTEQMHDLDQQDTAHVLQIPFTDDMDDDLAAAHLKSADAATLHKAAVIFMILDNRYGGSDTLFGAVASHTKTDLAAIAKRATKAVRDETSDAIRKLKEEYKAKQKPASPNAPLAQPKAQAEKGKPKKSRLSAEEAQSGIAEAMQGIEHPASFEVGQTVKITLDTERLGMTVQKHAGKVGKIVRREDGGGFWDVSFKGRTGGVAMFAEDQLEAVA